MKLKGEKSDFYSPPLILSWKTTFFSNNFYTITREQCKNNERRSVKATHGRNKKELKATDALIKKPTDRSK